ncbi:hypothetical protein M430DRAFT_17146 [Amorphotheca resinae ATCC 22711]|uniref:Uncharacterized protein n=1 Tax=Amorphotheca resinae ATCC 22711 TaxID=857342 RepID=A0A2T3B8L4_AMORE|nr:hypothetical protein M430DRAFT_17146 [Amorphotheca resinae ATCC 22711]PSS23219.1 hypothetical protein M430DRAFT_17146 [Amorphotheca resinae ATCC 22711]
MLLLPPDEDIAVVQCDGVLAVQQDIFDLGWLLYTIGVGNAQHKHLFRIFSRDTDEKRERIEAFETRTLLNTMPDNLLGRIQGPLRYGIGTKLQERGVLAVADYITMLAIFCYWLFF